MALKRRYWRESDNHGFCLIERRIQLPLKGYPDHHAVTDIRVTPQICATDTDQTGGCFDKTELQVRFVVVRQCENALICKVGHQNALAIKAGNKHIVIQHAAENNEVAVLQHQHAARRCRLSMMLKFTHAAFGKALIQCAVRH